jgi:hypothetical protein
LDGQVSQRHNPSTTLGKCDKKTAEAVCPSEVLSVEWGHVDWAGGRVTVPSPKTDRYAGKASRTIPLYPELRRHLEDARKHAPTGGTHVGGGGHLAKAAGPRRGRNCNLRTAFLDLVVRAGVEPWPRLFHNLRSSRETELLEAFPLHVVAQCMGRSPAVSVRHYAQLTHEHFDRAARGAESGARAAQNRAQQDPAAARGESQAEPEPLVVEVDDADSCDSSREPAGLAGRGTRIRPL